MPGFSGLSALTEAATALLSESPHRQQHREMRPSKPTVHTPPIVPEPDPSTQSFPELLMTLACQIANDDIITFLPDGKFFAIRVDEFVDKVLPEYFQAQSFDDFMGLLQRWGFARVLSSQESASQGIEVLSHRQFRQDDFELCSKIKMKDESTTGPRGDCSNENESHVSRSIKPSKSEDSTQSTVSFNKRRLSPGYVSRREATEPLSSPRKSRHGTLCDVASIPDLEKTRSDSSDADDPPPPDTAANASSSEDLREVALAITTQNLKLESRSESPEQHASKKLVDRAVESATQSIVTDAIETLLKDETHTRETFEKHKDELSKSSIPGIVPISQQLFAGRVVESPEPPRSTQE